MEMMVAWCSDLVFRCHCRHLKGEAAYSRAPDLFLTSAINLLKYCSSATRQTHSVPETLEHILPENVILTIMSVL